MDLDDCLQADHICVTTYVSSPSWRQNTIGPFRTDFKSLPSSLTTTNTSPGVDEPDFLQRGLVLHGFILHIDRWNHAIYNLWSSFFCSLLYWDSSMLLHVVVNHSFLLQCVIPLWELIYYNVFTLLLLMDICVLFQFEPVMNSASMNILVNIVYWVNISMYFSLRNTWE